MQIHFFPYLNMKDTEEVNFPGLNVKVWNYGKKADAYITDPDLRQTLDALMAINVSHRQTINDMGIISIGEFDGREFSDAEKALCEEAQRLLFIGAVSYSGVLDRGANTGHYMFTSENFSMLQQSFELNGERMGIESGYIVRKWDAGYKINEVKFFRPDYTPTPMMFRGNSKVISDLLKLRKYQKRLYRRLMRAISIVMQAYFNDTKLSAQARILLMASAYEILFDLPEEGQRKELKDCFNRLFVEPNDIKRRYSSQRRKSARCPNGYEWEIESIKVMWADKFYSLRNNIIHGSPIRPQDYNFSDKQGHFDISILFFVLGLKKIMGTTPQIKQTVDEITWKKTSDEVDLDEDEDDYEGFSYDELDSWQLITRSMWRGGRNARN
ncbi:MAG TPA: hypothetical protein VLG37_03880 [Candidatus Saccharimonadales bacterium]|nr:hypothetical protein [Candidatus Saccharimonadales bacterium]